MGTDQGYGAFNVLHQSTVRTGDRPDLAGVLFIAEIDPYAVGIGEGPAVKRSAAYDVDPLRGQLRTGPVGVAVGSPPRLAFLSVGEGRLMSEGSMGFGGAVGRPHASEERQAPVAPLPEV